jgi:hypothetical protein
MGSKLIFRSRTIARRGVSPKKYIKKIKKDRQKLSPENAIKLLMLGPMVKLGPEPVLSIIFYEDAILPFFL